jgi:hypothetical protein
VTREEFLAFEGASRDTIDVKRCYIDMAGDLVAGILLSQIVYWHLPAHDGEEKLTVDIDGEFWLAKRRTDWWDECRITAKQFDRAIEILEAKGVVTTMIRRFHGDPIKHVHLEWEPFLDLLRETLTGGKNVIPQRVKTKFPKQEKPDSPKVKNVIPQKGISIHAEITTKTLAETPKQRLQDSPENVNVRPEGKLPLSKHKKEALDELVQLTGDKHSDAGNRQLYDITHKAGCDQCWIDALEATRKRIQKSTQPLERPGAFFRSVLAKLLEEQGITVPTGTAEERAQAKAAIRKGLDSG